MSDTFIRRLEEERANNWSEMSAILDTAEAEGRDLSAEESERWDKLNDGITAIDERKAKIVEAQARTAAAEATRAEHAAVISPKADQRSDLDQVRALLTGELRSFEFKPSVEFRSLTTPGGSAIPTTFYDMVTVYERTLNPILQFATVLNTADGAPITLPRLTADPATGGTVTAEAAGIGTADPTISAVTLNAFKYATITQWSRELDEDNTVGLTDLLARSIARDLSLSYATHLTTGTGTTVPWGIVARAANGGTASGTANNTAKDTFFAWTDLVDLMMGRAAPYRQVGTFMASNTAVAKIRKMRDADNNAIFAIGVGQPDTIFGRPLVENPAMAAVASATKSVIFGDLSRYFVRRTPMRVEVSSEYGYSTDMLAIKVVTRLDADLVDTAAVAALVSANT